MAEKADTAILIRMERLGVRRAFPKKRLGVLIVSGPCLERLAKQSKCFRKVGWFAVPMVSGEQKLPPPCRVGTSFVYHRRPGGARASMLLLF